MYGKYELAVDSMFFYISSIEHPYKIVKAPRVISHPDLHLKPLFIMNRSCHCKIEFFNVLALGPFIGWNADMAKLNMPWIQSKVADSYDISLKDFLENNDLKFTIIEVEEN